MKKTTKGFLEKTKGSKCFMCEGTLKMEEKFHENYGRFRCTKCNTAYTMAYDPKLKDVKMTVAGSSSLLD